MLSSTLYTNPSELSKHACICVVVAAHVRGLVSFGFLRGGMHGSQPIRT
jgi:hypothetical protein